MKKMLYATILLFAFVSLTFAQSGKRSALFIGYSNLQVEGLANRDFNESNFDENFFDRREGLHGVEASYTGYFGKYVGITGDFSFNRQKDTFAIIGGEGSIDTQIYNFLAGPEIKARNRSRIEPFAHALFGGAHTRFKVGSNVSFGGVSFNDSSTVNTTDFAMALGGGLDIRLGGITVRAIQVDYNPIYLRDRSINVLTNAGAIEPFVLQGNRQDNVRFSVGVVF